MNVLTEATINALAAKPYQASGGKWNHDFARAIEAAVIEELKERCEALVSNQEQRDLITRLFGGGQK